MAKFKKRKLKRMFKYTVGFLTERQLQWLVDNRNEPWPNVDCLKSRKWWKENAGTYLELTYRIQDLIDAGNVGRSVIRICYKDELDHDMVKELADRLEIRMPNNGFTTDLIWAKIMEEVEANDDSTPNVMKRLWNLVEEELLINPNVIDWLEKNRPGIWKEDHLKNNEWRSVYLCSVIRISSRIQDVLDALGDRTDVSYKGSDRGLARIHLWELANQVFKLGLPENGTRKMFLDALLEKEERNRKGPFISTVGIPPGWEGMIV